MTTYVKLNHRHVPRVTYQAVAWKLLPQSDLASSKAIQPLQCRQRWPAAPRECPPLVRGRLRSPAGQRRSRGKAQRNARMLRMDGTSKWFLTPSHQGVRMLGVGEALYSQNLNSGSFSEQRSFSQTRLIPWIWTMTNSLHPANVRAGIERCPTQYR